MSELVIFETEHTKHDPRILYPSDGSVSQRAIEECHNWFDDRRARVVVDERKSIIESFVALRTDRGKRSAYVRFETDGMGELFSTFRARISQVIETEGWELLEQDPSSRDDTWLFEQLMHGELEQRTPSDLEFDDPEDAQALDTLLDGDHNAVVAVRTYRYAMDAILGFVGDGRSIVIYHRKPAGRQSVEADLDLIVQPDKSQAYVLSTETREAVEEYKNRQERHVNDLQSAIRGLSDHDVSPRQIFVKLDDQLTESYPYNSARYGTYIQYGFRGLSESSRPQEKQRERINTYLDRHFSDFKIPSPDEWKRLDSKSGSPRGRSDASSRGSKGKQRESEKGTQRAGIRDNKTYNQQGSLPEQFNRSSGSRMRILFLLAVIFLLLVIVAVFVIFPIEMPELFGNNGLQIIGPGGPTGAESSNATASPKVNDP